MPLQTLVLTPLPLCLLPWRLSCTHFINGAPSDFLSSFNNGSRGGGGMGMKSRLSKLAESLSFGAVLPWNSSFHTSKSRRHNKISFLVALELYISHHWFPHMQPSSLANSPELNFPQVSYPDLVPSIPCWDPEWVPAERFIWGPGSTIYQAM